MSPACLDVKKCPSWLNYVSFDVKCASTSAIWRNLPNFPHNNSIRCYLYRLPQVNITLLLCLKQTKFVMKSSRLDCNPNFWNALANSQPSTMPFWVTFLPTRICPFWSAAWPEAHKGFCEERQTQQALFAAGHSSSKKKQALLGLPALPHV